MTDISRQLERVLDVKERQKAVLFEAFEAPIEVDHWAYLDNPIAPTLGDPDATSRETGNTYEVDALRYMNNICDLKTEGWLDEAIIACIKQEIADAHEKRCIQNRQSMARIREHVGYNGIESLSVETLLILQAVRSGLAASRDRFNLLGRYPGGITIEDMKYTCPFDIDSMKDVVALYLALLKDMQSEDCDVEIYPKEKQVPEIDISMVKERGILLTKMSLAKVRNNDAIFESILRTNYVLLPPDLKTPANIKDNITSFQGDRFNLQPLFVTSYPKFIEYTQMSDEAKIYFSKNGEATTDLTTLR